MKIFGGYEPVYNSSYLDVEHKQIDHHPRRGIKLELEEANLAVTFSGVTVLRSETWYEGASRLVLPSGRMR